MDETTDLREEKVLQLLQDASHRVICDVARLLYSDEQTESNCGKMPVREYCKKVKLKISFDKAHKSLANNALPANNFDVTFAFIVIEKVCFRLYTALNQDCRAGINFLKKLLSKDDSLEASNNLDTVGQIEQFKSMVRAVYRGISSSTGQDLNKNLLNIDQMANNILYNYRKVVVQYDSPLLLPPTEEKEEVDSSSLSSKPESPDKMQDKPDPKTENGSADESGSTKEREKEKETEGISQKKTVLKRIKKMREKKLPEKITEGRKELIDGYAHLREFNACSWFNATNTSASRETLMSKQHVPLEKIFTNLRIRNGQQEVEMKDILEISKIFQEEEIIPPLVFLQGLAGSGKSSLSYHLVLEWQNGQCGVKGLCDFDFVILIKASRVRSNRLKEFLRDEVLPQTTANMKDEDIVPWLKTLDILFIFDGYYDIENVSYEILEDVLAKFGDQRIIVTTRPEVHKDFICMSRRYHMHYLSLEVCGFDVPRLKDFTYKVLNATEINKESIKIQAEEFLSYINGRGRVLDKHLKLPLTTLLLLFLWREEPDIFNKDTTATRLYELLYILYFNILSERCSKYFKGIGQIPPILDSLLLYIGEKAWDMINSGITEATYEIYEAIIMECASKGIIAQEVLSVLHMYQIDNYSAVCKIPIAFHHNTQMHYLAGTYLVDKLQRNLIKIPDINPCPGVEHVLMFVMGHLAEQNALTNSAATEVSQIINSLDTDPAKYEFWWSMLQESRFQSQIAYYIAKEKLPKKNWQLNEVNVVRALQLLTLTPVKLWTLIIDIPANKEPCDIPNFFESLLDAGKQLKKRQKRLVKVDMHLWNHEKSSHNTSDDFLRALHPWADLQSFAGHLGKQEDGEEIFATYINLRIIRVKVSTINSFHSLSSSLRKISKSVKTLHVIIALPKLSPPELLTDLKTSGNLEITVADMEDQYREWL
ncbi:hypothetical protein SK128_017478, partial [Halocaridina rubra]